MKPIYDAILKYIKSQPQRYHMPGHFGKKTDTMLYDSARFDITELPFSDNLQNPTGIICESESLAAHDYGAKRCFYFTSGSTTAIFTALASLRSFGKDIIVERASHKSTYSALDLFGFNAHYVMPRFVNNVPAPVSANAVEQAIKACPEAKVVIITSPNYFGLCADNSIASVCKKYGKLLLVDSAHGAHFPFSDLLPDGFFSTADIVVTSLHKTLPVYSGGAALLCNNYALFDKIQGLRADLHTTSPSYLILASIDYALDKYRTEGAPEYKKLFAEIDGLKKNLSNIEFLKTDDFTRIVAKIGKQGFDVLAQNNIVPEMTYGDYAVFIASPENGECLKVVENALKGFAPVLSDSNVYALPFPKPGKPSVLTEYVKLSAAVGRTSAREVGVYPPGIPVLARGELITAEIVEILKSGDTFGFVNDKLCVTID